MSDVVDVLRSALREHQSAVARLRDEYEDAVDVYFRVGDQLTHHIHARDAAKAQLERLKGGAA